jgi:hypothetical protein
VNELHSLFVWLLKLQAGAMAVAGSNEPGPRLTSYEPTPTYSPQTIRGTGQPSGSSEKERSSGCVNRRHAARPVLGARRHVSARYAEAGRGSMMAPVIAASCDSSPKVEFTSCSTNPWT